MMMTGLCLLVSSVNSAPNVSRVDAMKLFKLKNIRSVFGALLKIHGLWINSCCNLNSF